MKEVWVVSDLDTYGIMRVFNTDSVSYDELDSFFNDEHWDKPVVIEKIEINDFKDFLKEINYNSIGKIPDWDDCDNTI